MWVSGLSKYEGDREHTRAQARVPDGEAPAADLNAVASEDMTVMSASISVTVRFTGVVSPDTTSPAIKNKDAAIFILDVSGW